MRLQFPVFETPGDGGGGGASSGAPAPTGTGSAGGASASAAAEPSVIDIDNDHLIRIKGSDKPVKFGEHVKGFQAQFTKASQRAAQLEKQYDELQTRYQQEQQQRQAQPPAANGQPDVYASLEALPYLDGKHAAGVIRQIAGQFQQRDLVLTAMLKQLQQTQNIVRNLNGAHTSQTFESKIGKFLSDGGYDPKEYGDFARELYLAYEGDDLDTEFPTILNTRIGQLEKAFEAKRAAKVNAARRQPFVPGKGGSAGPSKPLEIKANAKGRELGAELWDQMLAGQGAET